MSQRRSAGHGDGEGGALATVMGKEERWPRRRGSRSGDGGTSGETLATVMGGERADFCLFV